MYNIFFLNIRFFASKNSCVQKLHCTLEFGKIGNTNEEKHKPILNPSLLLIRVKILISFLNEPWLTLRNSILTLAYLKRLHTCVL